MTILNAGDWFQIYLCCVEPDGVQSRNSIRFFLVNFCDIYAQLERLKVNQHESQNTSQMVHQLSFAEGTTVLLTCVKIAAKYSAMLKPLSQQLQVVGIGMMGVRDDINRLVKGFQAHPDGADRKFSDVIPEVKTLTEELGIDLTMPKQCARQVHRPNVGGFVKEYHCRTNYVPCMNSLIQSLESRFGGSNIPYFYIFALHPREAANKKMSSSETFRLSRKCTTLIIL